MRRLIQTSSQKPADGVQRAVLVQILVPAFEKTHDVLVAFGKVEHLLAHGVGNDAVVGLRRFG